MQPSRHPLYTLSSLLLLLFSGQVLAHGSQVENNPSFQEGMFYVLGNPEQLLALLGIGLWSTLYPKLIQHELPILLPANLGAGLLLGAVGLELPVQTEAFGLLMLMLGLLVTVALRLPEIAALLLIALFSFFNGYSHSLRDISLEFAGGFIGISLALYLLSNALGQCLQKATLIRQSMGLLIAFSGMLMMV